LPSSLRPADVPLLDFVVVSRRAVQRGQTLYRAGDPCDTIYPIRAGFFKTVVVSHNGDEQVTGLRMAGDVLGLDGVSSGRYTCDAIALDHGEVCVAPLPNLLRQSLHDEALQQTLYRLLGREIGRNEQHSPCEHRQSERPGSGEHQREARPVGHAAHGPSICSTRAMRSRVENGLVT
jgi:CRP/FNR family transcriptional regulator